jgi:hypothetical protein
MVKLFQCFDVQYSRHLQDECEAKEEVDRYVGLAVGVSLRVLLSNGKRPYSQEEGLEERR